MMFSTAPQLASTLDQATGPLQPSGRQFAVAQLGARRHYAVPNILHASGHLSCLYTDLCVGAGWSGRVLDALPSAPWPAPLKRALGRRPEIPPGKVRQFGVFGIWRAMRGRSRDRTEGRAAQLAANRRFGRLVVRQGFPDAEAVYVFNGAGLEILEEARRRGLHTVLDQTCAPVEVDEALLAEERERWPDWELESRAAAGIMAEWIERELAEWQLADRVVCGSNYVRDSLDGRISPQTAVHVVPQGVDSTRFHCLRQRTSGVPLNVLFVGTLQLRKGIPYLFDAAREIPGGTMNVRAVGPVQLSAPIIRQLESRIDIRGPVPRTEVSRHFEWADVFILPTISEGSANVCYEALASGLPVITTPNAGSVVRDGQDGFIVPIRDSAILAETLCRLADDRSLVEQMSQNAVRRASEFDRASYGRRLLAALT